MCEVGQIGTLSFGASWDIPKILRRLNAVYRREKNTQKLGFSSVSEDEAVALS